MALTKIKLGKLISISEDKNTDGKYGINNVKGISIQKKFIETKADMDGVSLKPYLLVKPEDFAYVTVTSRNGEKITLAHNTTDETYIVSSSYVVFRVIRKDILLPEYLFMYFNRSEFDRYSRFNSWGSARETFSWEEMCDIDFELPPIEIQRKYVEIYKGMIENQAAYETGLEDLKLVCDGYIEDLRKKSSCDAIKPYIEYCFEKNTSSLVKKVCGVESSGKYIDTRAKLQGVDISNYTIIKKGYIAYNPSRINLGSIALYRENELCVVSPMYEVFRIKEPKKLMPEYLMMWLSREEFYRYTWFYSAGSVRDTFNYNLMEEVRIPIPPIEIQQAIVAIYNAYILRKEINEQLKLQIKNICPVLIKGAVEEAKRS
ncbi:MAG: restriction endonuclease subunit S [Bacilli bacterium]